MPPPGVYFFGGATTDSAGISTIAGLFSCASRDMAVVGSGWIHGAITSNGALGYIRVSSGVRAGALHPATVAAGVEWHLPPDLALPRARALEDGERFELYQRALRPRPPLA